MKLPPLTLSPVGKLVAAVCAQWHGLIALALFLMWGLLLAAAPVQAQLAVPTLTAHVMDTTTTLDAAQLQQLERKLTAFEQSRGSQIVVLMVPTTQPEDIASYANRVADTWKVGRRDVGDGLLVIVAKNDRKVRIEVARTLEGAVPDLAAKRIIDNAITPRFKQGDFAGGLDAGIGQIMSLITGEALPLPTTKSSSDDSSWLAALTAFFIFTHFFGRLACWILGSRLGSVVTGLGVGSLTWLLTSSQLQTGVSALVAYFLTRMVFGSHAFTLSGGAGGGSSSGWSSDSTSSSDGGGFSSGGGGSFGGGGASGDW